MRWKIIGLVLLAAIALAAAGAAVLRPVAPPAASQSAANYTPPARAEIRYDPVAVIGDSYTGGSNIGGMGATGWPNLVRGELSFPDAEAALKVSGRGGSGYATYGPQGTTFATEVPTTVNADMKLVVFFGSRNDRDIDAGEVGGAAADTYALVKQLAPEAKLLVIGVPWINEQVPEKISDINDSIREAATAAGATFVDPLAEGWFFGDDAKLIGADGVHPTDAGHAYLVTKIAPHMRSALNY